MRSSGFETQLLTIPPERDNIPLKTYLILPSIEDYRDFHDKDWINTFFALANTVSLKGFEELADHFAANWHGAARAFVLPWLLVKAVTSFADGIRPGLVSEKELWESYKDKSEFISALGKNTENCFVALYCAYEDYLVNAMKCKLGKDHLRVTDRDFASRMKYLVGSAVTQQCWHDNRIDVAREVRHCIVHNGGRPTPSLLKKKPLPTIEANNILVSPIELRNLYALLGERIISFTQAIRDNANRSDPRAANTAQADR
jgi:hypothetical protein